MSEVGGLEISVFLKEFALKIAYVKSMHLTLGAFSTQHIAVDNAWLASTIQSSRAVNVEKIVRFK